MLWIKWVHSVYIKDTDWWECEVSEQASWVWKMICKMKNQVKEAYEQNEWLGGPEYQSIIEGYKWLTGDPEKVTWYHWVWNKANIPNYSLISWLVALGTRDKLYQAGVSNTKACMFCTNREDSCNHLFFNCLCST